MKNRYVAVAVLGFAIAMCGMQSAAAQQPAVADGVAAHLVVTVEGRKGSDVPVINREDVMVYEGHDRDQVTDWVPAQGEHAALGKVIGPSFAAGDMPGVIGRLIDVYVERRHEDERFIDTVRRIGIGPFKERVYAAAH